MAHKILIVEDDLATVEMLKAALITTRAKITTVFNGLDALSSVDQVPPDLILMDLRLPSAQWQGWDVIAALKNDPDLHHIPIIAISAGGSDCSQRALSAGAETFLDKPFRLDQLRKIVMHYLKRLHH